MMINKKSEDNAKKVYEMLAFQYKPIEELLLSQCNKKTKETFKKMSYSKKIMTLDIYAAQLGY